MDRLWHLACPASPMHYQHNPIKTAKTSFLGTYNMLGLARRVGARLLSAAGELVLLLTDWQAFAQIDWAVGCRRGPWAMAE